MNTVRIIAGPTASGKSARALDQALRRNGIIINADALQVYQGLQILTALPSEDDFKKAPHRLYATLSPSERCTVMHWLALVKAEIEQAFVKKSLPIVTGGTGFYLKALMEGLSPMPDVPAATRKTVEEELARTGHEAFHAKLTRLDPVMGARLHPHDTQRMIRAREVLEATGQSLSYWQSCATVPANPAWRFDVTIMMPERGDLYERCDRRFLTMMEQGALDEVRALDTKIHAGLIAEDAGITQALGFKALRSFLREELSESEAITQAQAETRHYAKRQVTWFRHQIRPAANIVALETVVS